MRRSSLLSRGNTESFLGVWLSGYTNPKRFVDELREKPAPQWGIYGQLLRAGLDSLLIYLPVTVMGRVPPTPSYLSFISTERYYAALIVLTPLVLMFQTLVGASFLHVALRLSGRASDFDQIVNLLGMAALVVGAVLIPWDWFWFAVGGVDQYFLGFSHLVISLWAALLIVLGLKRTLGIPVGLGVLLTLLTIPVGLPMAMMFMRSPF